MRERWELREARSFKVCPGVGPEPGVALSGQCGAQRVTAGTARSLEIRDSCRFSCEETEDTERSVSNVRGS